MSKRTRRTFSQEFKQQIVNLYLAGKPRIERFVPSYFLMVTFLVGVDSL
ncbi:hypothetical protein E5K16_002086, partial [Enterococcus faecium]|nr:hypothetical protein [Enterococcus faecium]EGP5047186.1 hypothetical protein [Enterococcus faecium]